MGAATEHSVEMAVTDPELLKDEETEQSLWRDRKMNPVPRKTPRKL